MCLLTLSFPIPFTGFIITSIPAMPSDRARQVDCFHGWDALFATLDLRAEFWAGPCYGYMVVLVYAMVMLDYTGRWAHVEIFGSVVQLWTQSRFFLMGLSISFNSCRNPSASHEQPQDICGQQLLRVKKILDSFGSEAMFLPMSNLVGGKRFGKWAVLDGERCLKSPSILRESSSGPNERSIYLTSS